MKMKDFQLKNDQKYQMFNNYQAQGNYQDAAKRDEEVMLKQMAERESKELNNIERKKQAELRNKDDAAKALR